MHTCTLAQTADEAVGYWSVDDLHEAAWDWYMIGLVELDREGGTPRYVTVREACEPGRGADLENLLSDAALMFSDDL
jgi:hypothetical protein